MHTDRKKSGCMGVHPSCTALADSQDRCTGCMLNETPPQTNPINLCAFCALHQTTHTLSFLFRVRTRRNSCTSFFCTSAHPFWPYKCFRCDPSSPRQTLTTVTRCLPSLFLCCFSKVLSYWHASLHIPLIPSQALSDSFCAYFYLSPFSSSLLHLQIPPSIHAMQSIPFSLSHENVPSYRAPIHPSIHSDTHPVSLWYRGRQTDRTNLHLFLSPACRLPARPGSSSSLSVLLSECMRTENERTSMQKTAKEEKRPERK